MSKKVELIIGVYPNQVSLDLNEDAINIALQYSIDDVRNIENINSNHSKTISLAGTKKNNIAFGGLFDVNSTFDKYNPNLRKPARIVVDSSPILEGYLQLTSIKKLNNTDLQGNKISYEVVVFDDSIDFVQSLGDKKLTNNSNIEDDLDFSALNHTYGKTAIEDAWNNHTYIDVFQYPMLDKTINEVGTDVEDGLGSYKTTDFKPAFYHKALLLEIAKKSGYTLEGDFIENNAQYEREIIAFNGDIPTIRESEAVSREFKAGFNTTELSLGSLVKTFNNDWDSLTLNKHTFNYDNEILDPENTFTPNVTVSSGVASTYTPTKTGRYNIIIDQKFYLETICQGIGSLRLRSGASVSNVRVKVRCNLRSNTTGLKIDSLTSDIGKLQNFLSAGTKTIQGDTVFEFKDVEIQSGESVFVEFHLVIDTNVYWRNPSTLIAQDVSVEFKTSNVNLKGFLSTFKNEVIRTQEIVEGESMEVNLYLPKDIKQKEILADIIKRYSVYVRKHPTKYKTLILETRDYFYNNNTKTLDWTQKKDYSTETKTQFLSELQNKEVLFTYKEANDTETYGILGPEKYNEGYTLSTGDVYGQKKISFNNEFVQGVKKIESIFSTTPLVYREHDYRDTSNGNTVTRSAGVVVPSVKSGKGKRNHMLLYWGGLTEVRDSSGNNTKIKISFESVAYDYSYYPYAGHYDNPYNPTLDIHFGEVTYEYYGVLLNSITDKNLFNEYWRNYYNQITEGVLVTSDFYLNETDVNFIKDNLNTKIYIKDSYYIINKVIDYKPLENGLTKVELLKIESGVTFEPTIGVPSVNLTIIDQSISVEGNGINTGPSRSNITNRSLSANTSIVGYNNRVGADSVAMVNGNNNIVSGDSVGVSVTGSNNFVSSGLSNVTIVGDDITVRESNTTVIGDLVIQGGEISSPNTRKELELELGSWDMGATSFLSVSHTLSATEYLTVRNLEVNIYADSGNDLTKLVGKDLDGLTVRATDFFIKRVTGGHFTGTNYGNNNIPNRGFLYFTYLPD